MNMSSISAMNNAAMCGAVDNEYLRIIRELRALGIEPSGDKHTDKMKLDQAKSAKRVQQNQSISNVKNDNSKQNPSVSSDDSSLQKSEASANMTGASQVSDMNKYLFLKKKVV